MSNNTSTECPLNEYFATIRFVSDYVIVPVHFLLVFPGRILLLIAFYEQHKAEIAYAYQIFVTVSETCELLTGVIYKLLWTSKHAGASWIVRNYFLMWYTAHASVPLATAFITTSLLLTLSMTVDRCVAVSRPGDYKVMNHKRNQWIVLAACFSVGLGASIFDTFRFYVDQQNDHYVISLNEQYMNTSCAKFLSQCRNFLFFFGLLALIVSNCVLIRLYREKIKRVVSDPNTSFYDKNRAQQRKATEKTLILLTSVQSLFTSIIISTFIVYFAIAYAAPTLMYPCAQLYSAIAESIGEMADILQFYLIVLVSKRFRVMLIEGLKSVNCCKTDVEIIVIL